MHAKIFLVCTLLVVIWVSATVAESEARKCDCDSQCRTYCCINKKCANNPKWCPCSKTQSPCEDNEKCVPQRVQCVKAPCYPIANCIPK